MLETKRKIDVAKMRGLALRVVNLLVGKDIDAEVETSFNQDPFEGL
jgi:hypothetical protein